MGILDFLGGNTTPAAPTPPASLPSNYSDFVQRLLAASNAGIDAKAPLSGRGLLNLLTGADRTAADTGVTAGAPSAWQQFQQGQSQTQNGQLGTAQNLASTSALTNTPIDPNNIMASVPGMTAAFSGVFAPPQGGGAVPAGAGDPLAQHRAFLLRMSKFAQMRGDNAGATEYFKAASQGLPEGTTLLPTGSVVDGSNGQSVNMSGQDFAAMGAGKKSTATEAPVVAGQMKVAGNQAVLDRNTSAIENQDKARYDQITGFDKTTGKPTTISKDAFANGRAPNFVQGDNPYLAGQQSEVKTLRDSADSADQGLDLAQQIFKAAGGLYTGKGANTVQDVRKWAQAAGALTGTKVSDGVLNDTSKFEQLKFASQQLVAVASHALSPRVSQLIYQQIAAIKPGDTSSMKGLRDIITNDIVPGLQRSKALYSGATDYYRQNPVSNDAMGVVMAKNPLENFRVKDLHSAQKGDFYIDPQSGNLRQRPK